MGALCFSMTASKSPNLSKDPVTTHIHIPLMDNVHYWQSDYAFYILLTLLTLRVKKYKQQYENIKNIKLMLFVIPDCCYNFIAHLYNDNKNYSDSCF